MTNQKTIPYHLQLLEPTVKEIKQEPALLQTKMMQCLCSCAANKEVNIDNLHEHLRIAMMLELSTIPPYLCALYSIKVGDATKADYKEKYGDNAEVASTIRTVMMEEMLHFTLVGNVLNATGGEVKINTQQYVPEYPTVLPDSAGLFSVDLSKFDKSALRTFLRIEQPTPEDTPPRLDGYATIGQFYHAIVDLMERLEETAQAEGSTIFTGNSNLQIDSNYYYGGGGKVIAVHNLQEAKDAIEVILSQGEGSEMTIYDSDDTEFDQIRELAHYFKFNEIYEEQRYATSQIDPKEPPQGTRMSIKYDQVYNMGINPQTEDFGSEDLKNLSNEFNQIYKNLLDGLQSAFTGQQNELLKAVSQMYQLQYKAVELMRNPIPCKNVNAGPTFEFLS
ncbi:hypothetical protein Xen7305DRAFT_00047610 [Xenococcus sp. PCC 7305]|uniref:ferritin-like domain-containing protein n=1 Tax=Xenococcus sp. PCC 7305 TaxID=102125 RepID=UPI0002ABC3B0|nr:ferritin-like protein [Xenococcus sp. PCC 7305]ELS05022.1 hypothetical protein Xen7305DRAFT_00047610 [Xenococcus sp. PCC 7305]